MSSCASAVVWGLIEQTFGIQPLSETQYSKPAFSLEESIRRANAVDLVEKLPDDEDAFGDNMQWSKECTALKRLAVQVGRHHADLRRQTFLARFFKSLSLNKMEIASIDPSFTSFSSLQTLNLSHNDIVFLENLPPRLTQLNIYSNRIQEVSGSKLPSLLHLGLGYNALPDRTLETLVTRFPNLISLDLSYNSLCNLPETLDQLNQLSKLKQLFLLGNPLTLHDQYRPYTVSYLPSLTVLDDCRLSEEELKGENQGTDLECQNVSSIQFDLSIHTLAQVEFLPKGAEPPPAEPTTSKPSKGTAKTSAAATKTAAGKAGDKTTDKTSASQAASASASASTATAAATATGGGGDAPAPLPGVPEFLFYVQHETPDGEWLSSPILSGSAAAPTAESTTPVLSFNHNIQITCPISVSLRDYLRRGLLIRLYHAEHRKIESTPGDMSSEQPPVVVPAPQFSIVGVARISLDSFIEPKLKRTWSLSQKTPLYQPQFERDPSFLYPASNNNLSSTNASTFTPVSTGAVLDLTFSLKPSPSPFNFTLNQNAAAAGLPRSPVVASS